METPSVATPPSPSTAFLPMILPLHNSNLKDQIFNYLMMQGKKVEFSPGSDKRFWSSLRSRVDTICESKSQPEQKFSGEVEVGEAYKRLSEDTAALLRGFDSVAHTLSKLSSNIDSALQGAKELAKPPTMADILQANLANIDTKESVKEEVTENGRKRKLEAEDDLSNGEEKSSRDDDKMLKKAKNLAISMATKATFLAKELKSLKSDLHFIQHRCVILEEDNEILRKGYNKQTHLEEDDLVRFQLEALLTEKSRLANENANLVRENQCLKQLVEYHQTANDTYEEVMMNRICLDFSSPPPSSRIDGGDDEQCFNGIL